VKQHRDVQRRFHASAATYGRHSDLQEQVADQLLPRWPADLEPRRLLETGCGTGVCTTRLHTRFPRTHITALDLAPAMLEAARDRLGPMRDSVTWVEADVLEYRPNPPHDAICSNCALHWITPLEDGFAALDRQLAPGGTALLSLMLDGTLGELHHLRRSLIPGQVPPGRLPDWDRVLQAVSALPWSIREADTADFVQTYPDTRTFLSILHEQGLTGGTVSRAGRLLTRGELQALCRAYDESFPGPEGGVRATYRVGFLLAQKPNGTA